MPSSRHSSEDLSLSEAEQLDRICSDFESRWRDGALPRLEDYWDQFPTSLRPLALRELLGVEFELRRAAGEEVDLAVWQRRFPGFEDLVEAAAAERTDLQFEEWVAAVSLQNGTTARMPPRQSPKSPGGPKVERPPFALKEPSLVEAPLPIRFEARRVLGQGGFGTVYLAHDCLHQCLVAVKCIRVERSRDEAARVMFRREAELAASLRHPGIVEIRELLEDDQSLLIVEEFLAGGDLKSRIVPGGLPPDQVVDWMISVADAVSFAHRHNLFHRDLKPGNILLDERGGTRVSDFGLAVRDDDLRDQDVPCRSGTAAYMSPEQARGETHRIDGRSDTWSLGVVLYELLTGQCPFRGTQEQILDQIRLKPPRPPRELRPELPVELERICLKCLQRRQQDRFSSVADLADDLRSWRNNKQQSVRDAAPTTLPAIVPKGLRAFEARDHQFFVELLPGPRDRDGLPESLRFWKQVIESPLPDLRLAVGVWHGPSGCGKSSLVRSGLLPCLSPGVIPVIVEASAQQTEERLVSALRLRVPGLPTGWSLPESLAAIRDGRVAIGGHKLLVVLDQFEQWLQQWSSAPPTGGVLDALRQCDGQHLQTLLLVRDDFWPHLLRLMERLEIPLQSHRNTVAVELFEPAHARKVLARFGQAYGALPRDAQNFTAEQEAFLDAAIEALTDQGRVICVRLALFAELMKSRAWTPAALRTVGGPQGLAVTYLNENLDPERVTRPRRALCTAAQAVLRALLPPVTSNLRGISLSWRELRELTGLAEDQQQLADLLSWLDSDLRLISPTTPVEETARNAAGLPDDHSVPPDPVLRYQLTHDFLVPALREWLRSKDLASAEGRARKLLAERAALWEVHPLDRLLPTFWEHLEIRRRTHARDRTAGETRYLRKASQIHLRRGLWGGALTAALLAVAWFGWQQLTDHLLDRETADRVAELKHARPEHWRSLIQSLSDPRLRPRIGTHLTGDRQGDGFEAADGGDQIPQRLARLLALRDRTQGPPLREALLSADPEVIREVRPALWESGGESVLAVLWDEAWKLVETPMPPRGAQGPMEHSGERAFRAAVILAGGAPQDPRWTDLAPAVIRHLGGLSSDEVLEWRELLQPVRRFLIPPLLRTFQMGAPNSTERRFAQEALVDFARDDSGTLAEALLAADPESFERLLPTARRQHQEVSTKLWSELTASRTPVGRWKDPADQDNWPAAAPEIITELRAAGGAVEKSFAFGLKIPLSRLLPVCEALRPAGYRPLHIHSSTAHLATGVAAVVWVRDHLDWTLLDAVPVQAAVEEDLRQASWGHEVNALLDRGPGKTTVLWGPPGAWGRHRKWVVGPRGRLDMTVLSLPVIPRKEGRWRVRFHPIPSEFWNDPDPDFEQISEGPPLFEGYFPLLEAALVSVRGKFNGIPRNLLCIADCDVDAPEEDLFLEANLVDGWRVAWDGAQIASHRDLGDDPNLHATTPVRVSTGRHTLRLELWWKELFSSSACRFGTSTVWSHTELKTLAPDWMLDTRVPVEPESLFTPLEPTFDLASVSITDQTDSSTEMDNFVRRGFRPFRILHDKPGVIRVDLCRPRPSPQEIDHWAARRARGVLALLELKSPSDARDPWKDALLPNLEMQAHPQDPELLDPTLSTELMRHLAHYRLPASSPWSHLQAQQATSVPVEARRQLWLSLGLAGMQMSPDARANWIQTLDLQRHWTEERDAGIHAALDWIRRHWELKLPAPAPISSSPLAIPIPAPGERPTWMTNSQGHTLSLLPAGTFWKGSRDPRFEFEGRQGRHLEAIDRPFALATFCVTAPEFQRFQRAKRGMDRAWQRVTPFPERANWIDAIQYLNWLSEQEGLQPCYEFSERGDVIIPPDCLDRTGYRLPTSSEWEYAARAGGGTDWIHGATATHLGDFAFTAENRGLIWSSSVGRKLPNPNGLFDMHGNGSEWMHDGPPLPADLSQSKRDDRMEKQILSQNDVRWLRSCDVTGTADSQRVYSVTSNPMGNHFGCIRPARTLRPKSQPETAQTSP